ncbi:UNVERIFIED_ORG: hypothetical protein QE446_004918 [Rhizobium sp. SORGH_AS260]|uniref:hypothetical protein n=1 Tax=Agrobacterium sp. SORGH_AS_0440 TaxID=3041757 RepID=UPI0011534785|nr:hypothetical protein [Agrobacterium sp. SORGH_AS_0440]MDP9734775.1 hypothetical protein [Rhizobium sp. SORGH_AS_0285]MDP9756994.1 hypothetical protein [Rhizobium sp. SORGH_AS_0260]MDR6083757.1 hypothetical protein [Agrobacterium sp. SORGH_AS_0440]
MTKLGHGWLASVGIVFVVGSAGGYTVGHLQRTDRTAELEQEIVRLEKEFGQKQWAFEFPSDTEASAAIAKSGRSIRISECRLRQAVPGVTCTGVITTTSGSFAGGTQPGTLSFAKIDGAWVQMQ